MGAVWLAEHAMLGRRAAIKVLHPSFANRPDIVARFFNEARAATAIADPGIVQIFDFGQHGEIAYIVMELLDGESLEHRLRRERALRTDHAVRLARQIASSLGAAHSRGIVHRDLKPDNIFLVPDPEVGGGERTKILDFGIAKLAGEEAGLKTQTSALMGTPMYMSPEQCRGAGGVDQRSDIYSLGCILFQLIAGRTVFQAEGAGELLIAHVTTEAPRLSTYVPSIPRELDALIARCLAKDPAQRPASGRELAALLATIVPGSSPEVAVSAAHLAVVANTTLSSATGVVASPQSRARIALPLALLALCFVATVLIVVKVRGSSSDLPTEQPIAPAAAPPIAIDAAAPDAATVVSIDAAVDAPPDAAAITEAPVVKPPPRKPSRQPSRPVAPPPEPARPVPEPAKPYPDPPKPDVTPDSSVRDGVADPFKRKGTP
jgi:serine/threonine-protein kinase